ncbi:hypothetical protein [Szabonella alba]|uniref:Uncharacterized protein n=1 Tax=Szabonella alba TaxID=2804194 RepID=A0A8K0VC36_9RHOB|nr:hypothetical protein [Szabonella alba]MBL4919342.1 hypothetical protein [Szabonella alba]
MGGSVPQGRRRVFLQPDPELAAGLHRAAPGAEVLVLGLAAEDGRMDLLQMNFAALNSFHEPAPALRALFPGLKVMRRQPVPVLSPGALLDRIGARGQGIDLVLDMPGSEMQLLEAWKAADALEQLRSLVLRCGSEVFFEGSAPQAQIEAWLVAEGFTRNGADLADPDWPVTQWQADPTRRALKKALAEAEARAGAAGNRADSAESALAEARKAAEALQTEHKALAEKADWRQRRIQELEAGARAAAEALAEAGTRAESAEGALAEARKAAEALQAEHKALAEKADWRHRRIQELEAGAREMEKTRDALRREVAEERAKHQDQQHRLEAARNDLRRAEGQIALIKDLLLRGETL